MEAPEWWYWITATFAVLGSLALIGLIVAVVVLIKKMKELQPKVQSMSDRIERIGERVERISETIENMAGSAKGTIDSVAGGANSLIQSLTAIGSKVEAGLAKFAPILVGIKLAQTAFAAFSDRKKAKQGPDTALPPKAASGK